MSNSYELRVHLVLEEGQTPNVDILNKSAALVCVCVCVMGKNNSKNMKWLSSVPTCGLIISCSAGGEVD